MKKRDFGLKAALSAFLASTMLFSPIASGVDLTTVLAEEPVVATGEGETESQSTETESQAPETESQNSEPDSEPVPEPAPAADYQDGVTSALKMTATVDHSVDKGQIQLSWTAPNDGTKGYKISKIDKNNPTQWVQIDTTDKTTYTDTTFSVEYADAKYLDVFLLQTYADAACTGEATGNYITVTTPYLFAMETGDSASQALYTFSACMENEAISYNLQAATASGAYTDANTDNVSSMGLVLNDYDSESGTTIKAAVAAYDVTTPGFEVGKTYYGRVTGSFTLDGKTYTSAPSNEVSFVATEPEKAESMIYTLDMIGIKNDSSSTANLEAYLKYDDSVPSTAFYHPGTHRIGKEGGFVVFVVPKDKSASISSYALYTDTAEDGAFSTKVTPATNLVKLPNTTLIDGFDTYAFFYNGFPIDGVVRWYAVKAEGVSDLKSFPICDASLADWVQDVTIVANNAKKLTITWLHDDCVKSYEVYRSINDVSAYNDETMYSLTNYKKLGKVGAKKNIVKKAGVKYHKFIDKKVPSADKYYYYIIKPVFANGLYKDMDLNSEPAQGKGDVTKARVKSLTATCKNLTEITLEWKGLKNVSTYSIYRNDEFLDEVSVAKGKQTKPQTYSDKNVKPGKNYIYAIRPGNKEGDEGKKRQSNPVNCAPQAVSSLKATYRTAGQGASVSWDPNSVDKSAAESKGYTYAYEIRIDNGAWSKVNEPKFEDTSSMNNGAKRTYSVRVSIYKDGNLVCSSPDKSVEYTASGKITVYAENGVDVITTWPWKQTIKVGQKAVFKVYSDSKAQFTVVCTSGSGAVTVGATALNDKAGKSGAQVSFAGVAVGTQTFEVRTSDGGKRTFTFTVTQ